MSSKIVQGVNKNRVSNFTMRQFSTVERGKKDYIIRSFADDEEFSVQDNFSLLNMEEPETITAKEDEITDKDYLPPSKLAKAEDGIVGEKVEFKQSLDSKTFVESDVFSDNEDLGQYNEEVISSNSDDLVSSEEIASLQSKIELLEDKIKSLEEENSKNLALISEKDDLIAAKDKEIEEINSSIPLKIEESKALGYDEGYKKGEEDFAKQYDAEKSDYISKVEEFNKASISKIDEIEKVIKELDDYLPETVLGFVKSIVGAERKFNDQFIVTLINNNLHRLKELKNISFVVNPADLDIVKGALPDYVVSTDTTMLKGCVKVNSKIGEVSLDSDVMIEDLERQINEKLGATENS